MDPRTDPAIDFEPHLQSRAHDVHPSEAKAEARLPRRPGTASAREEVEHTVWDEPALAAELRAAPPQGELTYARWLEAETHQTKFITSLWVTLVLIVCAGPWGVLGVFINGLGQGDVTVWGFLAIVLVGPVTEEITKVATIWWAVEKRPFWFKAGSQIVLCAAAGGAMFAVIENLIYLHVYLPGASRRLAEWRWTICTLMHVTCSTIVGLGLARMWGRTMERKTRPALADAVPFLIAAMVIHGSYNLFAVVGNLTGWLQFE